MSILKAVSLIVIVSVLNAQTYRQGGSEPQDQMPAQDSPNKGGAKWLRVVRCCSRTGLTGVYKLVLGLEPVTYRHMSVFSPRSRYAKKNLEQLYLDTKGP
jgi:hypothetical protein